MEDKNCDPLQLREIFHLEFLRWLGKAVKMSYYSLKGGVNLRFFYNSFRYSEDIDLNARLIRVDVLQNKVMQILKSTSFQDNLKPFGINKIIPPNIAKAKQTPTTQRFKVHLITPAKEDFFTKIDFSRRKFSAESGSASAGKNNVKIETVSNTILREYKLAPFLVPHYDIISAVSQKLDALAARKIIQARDAFDIYILSAQFKPSNKEKIKLNQENLNRAYKNIFEISFEQFRDTVISYLSKEDQEIYNSSRSWDEIKLKVANFIKELRE